MVVAGSDIKTPTWKEWRELDFELARADGRGESPMLSAKIMMSRWVFASNGQLLAATLGLPSTTVEVNAGGVVAVRKRTTFAATMAGGSR